MVACLSSTTVILMVFSPLKRLMFEEKFPEESEVVRTSSLSETMATLEFGFTEPLREMTLSVTTALSWGVVMEIWLADFLEGVGVALVLVSSTSVSSVLTFEALLARLIP